MKKSYKQILAAAGLLSSLTFSAGNNPNRVKLGEAPDFGTSKSSSSLMKVDVEEQPRAVIKMNISQLGLKNLSFQGEYGFHKNMSVGLGFNFMLKRKLPGFFSEEDPTGEGLRNTAFKGWAITPEFRFYPGRKEEHVAPHGFYLGLYYRHSKHSLTSGYTENFTNGKTYSYDMELSYIANTAGLMIGSQWIIGKHFSIDWWILGGGVGSAKFQMEASGTGFIMNADEQAEVKKSVEDELSGVQLLGLDAKVTTTTNSVKAVVSGLSAASFRGFGLCLGFAF